VNEGSAAMKPKKTRARSRKKGRYDLVASDVRGWKEVLVAWKTAEMQNQGRKETMGGRFGGERGPVMSIRTASVGKESRNTSGNRKKNFVEPGQH